MECINNKEVVVEPCDDDVCPILINDSCVQNTIIDVDFGFNGLMNTKEVILILMERILKLETDLNNLKRRL